MEKADMDIMHGYREGEFESFKKAYNKIRNHYYLFGAIRIRRQITEKDAKKLTTLASNINSFEASYSARHNRVEMNTEAIEMRMSIDRLLKELQ